MVWFLGIILGFFYLMSSTTPTQPINWQTMSSLKLACINKECKLHGDVEIPENHTVEQDVIAEQREDEDEDRNLMKAKTRRWPDAHVPFAVHEYFLRAENLPLYSKILEAIQTFENSTCIKFTPVKNLYPKNYVAFIPSASGCRAQIGYLEFRKETIIEYSPDCFLTMGTLQHEIFHALGAKHEHARPDRDEYVSIQTENVKEGQLGNFEKASPEMFSTFGLPYDYRSIMHYDAKAFTETGEITIKPKDPQVDPDLLGQREKMTELDIKKINRLYDCKEKSKPAE